MHQKPHEDLATRHVLLLQVRRWVKCPSPPVQHIARDARRHLEAHLGIRRQTMLENG